MILIVPQLIELSVYPNPFRNEINIAFKGKLKQGTVLRILNSVGQTVMQKELFIESNQIKIELDSSLHSGIYLLMLVDETGIVSKKLIKKV